MAYQKTGVLTEKDLKQKYLLPSNERFDKGPVVIVECVEKIPCNPCVDACPKKVISIKGSINEIPKVNFDSCNGCGLCIARCPGLAIFVVHKNYNQKESAISLPYEFLPRPQKGQIVNALDRKGKVVCLGRVEKVIDTKAVDRCAIVTIAVPKKFYNKVRFFKMK
ncbi:MAG: 4Fe-4S binding protein [candidate division WOR-3 bacterium]|nr:4Fe-4S binding protein [candidate division WOR-3 bacterium]